MLWMLLAIALASASLVTATAMQAPGPVPAPRENLLPVSEEERLRRFSTAGRVPQFTITFRGVVPDAIVQQILGDGGLKPFVVHMTADGMSGVHRIPVESAGLDIVAEARSASSQQTNAAIRATEATMQNLDRRASSGQPVDQRFASHTRAMNGQARAMAATLSNGRPITYGVAAVGPATSLSSIRGSSHVASVAVGIIRPDGKVALPHPQQP